MSKRKPNEAASPAGPRAARKLAAVSESQAAAADGAIRETIESVVIAIALAFLFRTFEAEAFVIPTGSMATTLMGRHKDLYCPQCGARYQANAANEVDKDGRTLGDDHKVEQAQCPYCRFTARKGIDIVGADNYESYSGDRIIVDKLAYEIRDPRRWDVVVFKYPEGAQTNYIKRLVGLPGETIRIRYGDLFAKGPDDADFTILQKPPAKLAAIMPTVYDADYPCAELKRFGCPARWQSTDGDSWQPATDERSFAVDGKSTGPAWLRYHHYVPMQTQWNAIKDGRKPALPFRAQLITDFAPYNTARTKKEDGDRMSGDYRACNWIGDLALECELTLKGPGGKAAVELVKGGRTFTCTIDSGTGAAALAISGQSDFQPRAATALKGPGTHALRFANVDRRLLLWVNGRLVKFEPRDTTYPDLDNHAPTRADLSPAGINVEGVAAEVRHLRLRRDLYYIAIDRRRLENGLRTFDYGYPAVDMNTDEGVARLLSDPAEWGAFARHPSVEFQLEKDQFFVLGDNSQSSADGRYWNPEYFVRRELFIGRALFVFWPHSWDRVEIGSWRLPFWFFPNFSSMRFVR